MRGLIARYRDVVLRRAGPFLIAVAIVIAAIFPLLLGGRAAIANAFELRADKYVYLFVLVVTGWLLRAFKQGLLMQRLGVHAGVWRTLGISLAIDCAFLATPGGVGGYAAGIYYVRKVGASYAAATAIAAGDQLLDLLFFALAMPLAALSLAQVTELPPVLARGAAFGGLSALIALIVLISLRRHIAAWFFGARGPVERYAFLRRRRESLQNFFANVGGEARLLMRGSPAYFALAFSATAVQWLTRYGALWLILELFGHSVPFALLLLLQGVVLHVAQWTGMPAGGGGADLGLAATLAPFVPTGTVASALLLWRIGTLYLPLTAGTTAVIVLRWRDRMLRTTLALPTE